jgi:uncharacterized protein
MLYLQNKLSVMIQRTLFNQIRNQLFKGKTIMITGPRQSGKTTLLEALAETLQEPSLMLNCDEPDIRKELTDATSTRLNSRFAKSRIVMIDEAQRVKNIGLTLKLIHDKIPGVQLIVTGSSSLELSGATGEPLTGRKIEFRLLPLSTEELITHTDGITEERLLHSRLVFGMYPDVVTQTAEARRTLKNLTESYLYKDVFSFQDIRKPEMIETLLEAIALQIGSEVSYTELASLVGIDQITIRRYLDLLEKSFVVFRLRALARNVRTEIRKTRKIYFYDTGIRNAILSNFSDPSLRSDKGALWENFLVSERMKFLNNHQLDRKQYFWRTAQQQEIDYIEEQDGKLFAWEFKWQEGARYKIPMTFTKGYPEASSGRIDRLNYMEFLTLSNVEEG